jgi:hypothetical protein
MTLVRSVSVPFFRFATATFLRRRLPLLLWEASWLRLATREGDHSPLVPHFLGRRASLRGSPDPPQSDGSFAALFYDGGSGGAAVARRRIGSLRRTTLTGSPLFSLFFFARSFASITCSQ